VKPETKAPVTEPKSRRREAKPPVDETKPPLSETLGFIPLEIEYEGERTYSGFPRRLRVRAAVRQGEDPAEVHSAAAAWVEEKIDNGIAFLEMKKKSLTEDVEELDRQKQKLASEVHDLARAITTIKKTTGAAKAQG
jgi:hypothetical protein